MLLIDRVEQMSYPEFLAEYAELYNHWLWTLSHDKSRREKEEAKQAHKSLVTMYISFNPEKTNAIRKMTREWEITAFGSEQ